MKYSDIVNFEPIVTVIELKDANDKEKAKGLVESYVMSDEMATKFNHGIINELQFENVVDNKGVLIVGNYGTGKSHLMSLISSVVNDADNLEHIKNKEFANHIEKVAGKFEVLRIEIGSVSNSLRNIIVTELQNDLKDRGIHFEFPSADEITNNKAALLEMMSKFEEVYPEKGYLLVIDELLDYLRTRKEHDLMLDLGFLRELGEFIKSSRFRLICGIQEQLFENPAFSFVSKSLSRVKDRFEQVIIRKEDTSYVVSERILGKTPEQKAIIRGHLEPFCSLYSEMSERLDDYVELYPIHPSYIEIFNKVYVAEKREVLKTISVTIQRMLDTEISESVPGIISFDSYWNFIKDNYARKSEAEIKEVMDKSSVLEDKIFRTFPKKQYKTMAIQIINALSVHRLTTHGIDVAIGLTAENLKDDLCLFIENLPEMDSEFLLGMIQTVIKDIVTLVSGQFIENNPDNGQYYLDLKKDIDYDAKISQKADMLDDDDFNRYFFKLVYDALEWDAEQYVPNFEIYEYLLNWDSKNAFRRGYLFMGQPKERSTAQPPRDFYIYLLPPYGDSNAHNKFEDDEVMFEFKGDEEFFETLKLFSAASALRGLAADQNTKGIYKTKLERYRKKLLKWLNDNKNTCFDVHSRLGKKQLLEATNGKSRLSADLKDAVDLASSICLDDVFNERYPEFPRFEVKLTLANQASTIERAFNYFAGKKTKDSIDFLKSFNLLQNDKITVENSKYTMHIVKMVEGLSNQGVINRSDIVIEKYDESFIKAFNINVEYYCVVLLALVYTGHITLKLRDGKELTASNIETVSSVGIMDIYEFKHISKPKQAAISELKRLFEILDLPSGIVVNQKELEKSLSNILERTSEMASKALHAKRILDEDFSLWGEELIPSHISDDYKYKIGHVLDEFGNFKNKYNTVAKLNNINLSMNRLEEIADGSSCIDLVYKYEIFKAKCETITNYISNIETMDLPKDMVQDIARSKDVFRNYRDSLKDKSDPEIISRSLINELSKIKNEYIDYYFDRHNKLRLNINDKKKKDALLKSNVLSNLKRLKDIEAVFQVSKLNSIEKSISALQPCYELTTSKLEKRPVCPHCHLRDLHSGVLVTGVIDDLEIKLDTLKDEWTNILIQSLDDPLIMDNKNLLEKKQQGIIDTFFTSKNLPESIDTEFVKSFNMLFSELEKVNIDVNEMLKNLLKLGPCTIDEFKRTMNSFIDRETNGMDKTKLRLILNNNLAEKEV